MNFRKQSNIILVGPMGVGKTTVGKRLAQTLNKQLYDSDKEIEKRAGTDLTWIFDLEGEQAFRLRENQIIQEILQASNLVLSTGGGSILVPEIRKLLTQHGTVVYLQASLSLQKQRTDKDKKRPLLREGNSYDRLHNLHMERHPLYLSVADTVILTDNLSLSQTIKEICLQLSGRFDLS